MRFFQTNLSTARGKLPDPPRKTSRRVLKLASIQMPHGKNSYPPNFVFRWTSDSKAPVILLAQGKFFKDYSSFFI